MFNNWRLLVATRYSMSGTTDHLVSFMSLVSITGLVLGVAVLVIVLSVMNGFEEELRLRVLGVVPHGIIYSRATQPDWAGLESLLQDHAEVIATAPLIEGAGLVLANGKLLGAAFTGVDPVREHKVSIVSQFVTNGAFEALQPGAFNVVLGEHMARELGVDIGDRLTLVTPEIRFSLAGPLPTMKRLRVVALFKVGSDIDKSQLYLHINDAQKIKRQTGIDGIRVQVRDLFSAPAVIHALIVEMDDSLLYGQSWMSRHGNLYDAIQMQKTTMFLLLLMLVAVAAFNVVSNLMMTVRDKQADIAILRTIGASPGAIRTVFIIHGFLVGVVGVSLGILIGTLTATWLGDLYASVDRFFGLGLMDEYFIQYLPTRVLGSDILVITMVSLMICLLATIYPASSAASTNPVEALQNEG